MTTPIQNEPLREAQLRIRAVAEDGAVALNLTRCELSTLPEEIKTLTHLTDLYLDGNQLSSLPEWIGDLRNLTRLNVSGNPLCTLPDRMGELTNLVWLHLGDVHLSVLPHWIGNLTNLTRLNLSGNQLTQLPETLGNLTKLNWLILTGNELATLPDTLGNLASLNELYLAGNQLTTLPDSLGGLTNLYELYLEDNQLTSLPDGIGKLTKLARLSLDRNRLTELPGTLANLTRLGVLHLDGNELTSPPPEVVAAGVDAVRAYLRANLAASVRQWTSKLMIVGEARVGKSSLVKALAGHVHDFGEPTTHGLSITRLSLAHPAEVGITMDLSVWDFGGQDIYHATHQFFLTRRSLFVLVWNAYEGTERGRLRYWLGIISARAPGAPVIIVATHTADRPADIDLAGLRADYPAILGHVSVDCAVRTGMESLRAAIADAAAELPLMGAVWPQRWITVAELTRRGRQPFMPVEELWRLMERTSVLDTDEQRSLALALHHRGDILYFPDDEELADVVIRDPQWLNAQISRILDDPDVAARCGVLTSDDLVNAWTGVPRAQREHMLTLMDRFDVIYLVRDSQDGARAIVVGWLPQSPPDYAHEWESFAQRPGSGEIRVVYQLPVLPPGIPGWFLARSHRFATAYRWRTGAMLAYPDGEHAGLLRTDTHRQRIELTVRGPLPAPFFAILDDGLNLTFDRYPGMKIIRWVPCRGHGACEKEFDYTRIVDRVRRGHHQIYCDVAEAFIDIGGLLTGITPPVRDLASDDIQRLISTVNDLRDRLASHHGLAQRDFLRLTTLIQNAQQVHCPSVFTITPTGERRLGKTVYRLRLYCEEPGTWHPLPGDTGQYEIAEIAPWLRAAGPFLAKTLHILKAAVPYAGPILGIAVGEMQQQLTHELNLTQEILNTLRPVTSGDPQSAVAEASTAPSRRAETDADYRLLRAMLLHLDPLRHWGGLSHVLTPEGLSLYLCREHVDAYRRRPAA